MAFNLDDYTTVQQRSNIFWERYPNGAIRTELVESSNTRFIVVCKLFKDANDTQPFAIGHAQEVISDRGVNRDFALENCETSSRGVAFKCANIGTEKNSPSREEMEKVARVEQTKPIYSPPNSRARLMENALRSSFDDEVKAAISPDPVIWSVGEVVDQIGTAIPNPPPECEHGHILKQGISTGGRPYYGYVCKGKVKEHASWAKMSPNGRWFFDGENNG
jgi:hypothetical protein